MHFKGQFPPWFCRCDTFERNEKLFKLHHGSYTYFPETSITLKSELHPCSTSYPTSFSIFLCFQSFLCAVCAKLHDLLSLVTIGKDHGFPDLSCLNFLCPGHSGNWRPLRRGKFKIFSSNMEYESLNIKQEENRNHYRNKSTTWWTCSCNDPFLKWINWMPWDHGLYIPLF